MDVEEIAVGRDITGQGLRHQEGMPQRLIGGHPCTRCEQSGQSAGKPLGQRGGGLVIAAADVGMRQRRLGLQPPPGVRQRLAEVAQEEMVPIRPVGGMSTDLALEDEDFPRRQPLAQVVVGATVAQAELEHWPRQIGNPCDRQLEAGSLRLKPTDEAVETAHMAFLDGHPRIAAAAPPVNKASA